MTQEKLSDTGNWSQQKSAEAPITSLQQEQG